MSKRTPSLTSQEAYKSILPAVNALQARVLEWFYKNIQATDEELVESTGLQPSTARGRRSELVKKGYLRDSGVKRLTRSRRRTVVWETVPERRQLLFRLEREEEE